MSLKTRALKALLAAVCLASLAAPLLRAASVKEAVQRLIESSESSDDPNLRARALALKSAINLNQIEQFRYKRGGKGERSGLCISYDCSGFISSTVGFQYKLPGALQNAEGMYEGFQGAGAERGAGQLGDIIFFHPRGESRVSHVGIYLENGRFLHMSGREGDPIKIGRLGDFASRSGDAVKYTWGDVVSGYGDLSRLEPRSEDEKNALAARSTPEVRAGENEPGGVVISPDLVLEAARLDVSGALDAMEAELLEARPNADGTVELPDGELPQGFEN